MLKNKLDRYDRILMSLLSLWLLVDMINGFFLGHGVPLPVSQIYKPLVVLLIVLWHPKDRKINKFTVSSLFYVLIYGMVTMLGDASIVKSITLILKPVTSIIIFLYFTRLFRVYDNELVLKRFINIILFSILIVIVNILLGLKGIGYHSYDTNDQELGFCGFFYSPNELGGVFAVLYPLVLAYVICNKSRLVYIATIIIFAISCVLMSTKSSFLILAIAVVLITYSYGTKFERRFIVFASVSGIYVLYRIIDMLLSSEHAAIERLNFFIERNGLLWALTSGRLEKWEDMSTMFYDSDFFFKVFGLGQSDYEPVEMDPYDLLLNCGYIGLLVLMMMYYKLIREPYKLSGNIFSKAVLISNCLLVFMSIITGHIFFSSMAGMLIALSNSLLYYRPKSLQ